MPELAEVETVRNVLKEQILNKKIKKIDVFYEKMIENNKDYFINNLINESFIDIIRKGKYLIFETSKYYLISHLRMEGKYFIKDINDKKEKHEHVIFIFDDFTLRYHDTRKFGRMKLINKNELNDYFKNVGPDANNIEDIDNIYKKIKNKNIPIKTILLDQSIIAGLGNIYVDEVLFASKISPLKIGKDITKDNVQSIINNSKIILNNAIKEKGTTIRSYTSSLNVKGNYQKYLMVHTKSICKNCGENILKVKIGGRSTYYCEKCQNL